MGINIKKNIKHIFCIAMVFSMQSIVAQTFSSKKNKTEAENIINTVLNSKQFDSVYPYKKVYFITNELLKRDTPLRLKKGKRKVIIQDSIKNKTYVVLGDFTTDWNNIVGARIQLEFLPNNILLNMYLIKRNNIWETKNYSIIKDE